VHDVSEGGIACAAAEMALASGVGVVLDAYDIPHNNSEDFILPYKSAQLIHDETSARYLIATTRDVYEKLDIGHDGHFPPQATVGKVQGNSVKFIIADDGHVLDVSIARLREAHEGWLPNYMSSVE
jgi:phosphoribosylformylglycinamidine (FGAM) synthase-like enzyme